MTADKLRCERGCQGAAGQKTWTRTTDPKRRKAHACKREHDSLRHHGSNRSTMIYSLKDLKQNKTIEQQHNRTYKTYQNHMIACKQIGRYIVLGESVMSLLAPDSQLRMQQATAIGQL